MNKEKYRILKELGSLANSIISLQNLAKDDYTRIHKIEQQRKERLDQKEINQEELNKKRGELSHLAKDTSYFSDLLLKGEQQLKALISENEILATTKQIENSQLKLEQCEDQAFQILLDLEHLDIEISKAKKFLKGSLETIDEIEKEIESSNGEFFKEIKIKENRINNLHSQLPKNVLEKLEKLSKKSLKYGPLAQITPQSSCEHCGYLISTLLVTKVEKDQLFSSCPGCERIFIPQSVKYI